MFKWNTGPEAIWTLSRKKYWGQKEEKSVLRICMMIVNDHRVQEVKVHSYSSLLFVPFETRYPLYAMDLLSPNESLVSLRRKNDVIVDWKGPTEYVKEEKRGTKSPNSSGSCWRRERLQ